ncbi:MAG: hypothetical protein KDB00_26775 [Planctomycetales bacterium]|nr:hypothetical protein [Planctomycetales bacterium]
MAISAREYLCKLAIGDHVGCKKVLDEISATIRTTFGSDSGDFRGTFWARVLSSVGECEEEGVSEEELLEHTGGNFPVVFLNFTFDPSRVLQKEIETIDKKFSLSLLGTAEAPESDL